MNKDVEQLLMKQLEVFKQEMAHTAEQTIKDLYCDVLPYVLSDAEQNMANIVSELLQKILVGDFEVKGESANWQFQVKDSKGIQHFIFSGEYLNEKFMKALFDANPQAARTTYHTQLENEIERLKRQLQDAYRSY